MSAKIIRFIPRPNLRCGNTDFPAIAFWSATPKDSLVMDHADTAPCEYAPRCDDNTSKPEN